VATQIAARLSNPALADYMCSPAVPHVHAESTVLEIVMVSLKNT